MIEVVRERIQTVGPDHAASMGPLECVMFFFSKSLMWKFGGKIMFMDASRAHCQADATSEVAIELPPEEQVKGEDLTGELVRSLFGTRTAAHTWEKKWEKVLIDNNFESSWSPAIVCCRERELCGFVHGDDIISAGESMQLAWAGSRPQ